MDYLPYVMLGRHVSFQHDLGASPAEYVFGETLEIPGTLTNPEQNILSNSEDLLNQVKKAVQKPTIQMSRHREEKIYEPDSMHTTTHVYLKVQDAKSLMPRFMGPFLILDRPTRSTLVLK